MYDNQQRIDEFKTELAALRTKSTSSATGDRRLLALGVLFMIGGVVAIVAGYWGAANTLSTPEAISYLLSGGMVGMALVIIGIALFLRYSMAAFLKFWLVRWVYEQQAQTDRVIEAMGGEPVTPLGMDTTESSYHTVVDGPGTPAPPEVGHPGVESVVDPGTSHAPPATSVSSPWGDTAPGGMRPPRPPVEPA